MTLPLRDLLDDRRIEGPVAVWRELSPPRVVGVLPDDYSVAACAVDLSCQLWAGASQPLVPGAPNEAWGRVIDSYDPDHEWAPPKPQKGLWLPGTAPLLLAIGATMGESRSVGSVEVVDIDIDDSWHLAYLSTLGHWPKRPEPDLIQTMRLRSSLDFTDMVNVHRLSPAATIDDLIDRVQAPHWSPARLTLLHLSTRGLPHRTMPGSNEVVPRQLPHAYDCGPNIVIVYEEPNTADLCLAWTLRAAHGWPVGLPIAMPDHPGIAASLQRLVDRHMFSWMNLAPVDIALISETVPMERLREIAASAGDRWIALGCEQLLQAPHGAARTSGDVAVFHDGRADVATWSPADAELLESIGHRHVRFRTVVTLVERPLPPSLSLRGDNFAYQRYRHGGVSVRAEDPGHIAPIRWPRGWTVLEGLARDRGLRVRRSPAGLAAEAFVRRCGSMGDLTMLATRGAANLVSGLTEREGMSWLRKRLRERGLTEETETEDPTLRTAHADDARAWDYTKMRRTLDGDRAPTDAWIEWAEARQLVVRGAAVDCDSCGGGFWMPLADVAPPIICRGCGQSIERPFLAEQMRFRYRPGHILLQLFRHDALAHVLAIRWLAALFRSGTTTSAVYGFHPGVEFSEPDGRLVAEVDVVVALASGELAIGECKRTGAGLNEDVLSKLDAAAERLASPWTFVATLSLANECPPLWRQAARRLPDRPRFMLPGDRLFDWLVSWRLGEDPFSWPAEGEQVGLPVNFLDVSKNLMVDAADDRFLFEHLDRRGADRETNP